MADPTDRITSPTLDTTAPVWTVVVEWAFARPPTPQNTTRSAVIVTAESATEATTIACQMVSCRRECVMPTRATIIRSHRLLLF